MDDELKPGPPGSNLSIEDERTNIGSDIPGSSLVGMRLGKYAILSVVGKGGSATVYRAEDDVLKRSVAVKFLHPEMVKNQEFVRRFRNEAKVIAVLNHPNIVQVYDYSEEAGGQIYIVTEFVEGLSLAEFLKNLKVIFEEFALMICEQVLKGLEHAHGKGLIHRDIKPGNVLISADGQIKIGDFGLAKFFTAKDQDLTRSGLFVGTPSFASPEQIEGDEIDQRSDIFSLGTLLFALVTGRHPFKKKDDKTMKVWARIINAKHPEAIAVNPSVSAECNAIIERALNKEPSGRFQTAAEMRAAIEQVLSRRKIFQYQDEVANYIKDPERYLERYKHLIAQRCYEVATELYGRGERAEALRALSRSLALDGDHFEATELSKRILSQKKRRLNLKIGLVVAGAIAIVFGNVVLWRSVGRKPGARYVSSAATEAEKRLPQPEQPAAPSEGPKAFGEETAKESLVPPSAIQKRRSQRVSFFAAPPSAAVVTKAQNQVLYLNSYAIPVTLLWAKVRGAAYYRTEVSQDGNFTDLLYDRYVKTDYVTLSFAKPGMIHWRVTAYGDDDGLLQQSGNYGFKILTESARAAEIEKNKMVINVDEGQPVTRVDFNPYGARLKLIWNKVPKANRYRYEFAGDAGFKKVLFFKTVELREGVVGAAISESGTYYWRVSLLDEYDEAFYVSEPKTLKLHLQPNASDLVIEGPKNGVAVAAAGVVTEGLLPYGASLVINGRPVEPRFSKETGSRFRYAITALKSGENLIVYELKTSQPERRELYYRVVNR